MSDFIQYLADIIALIIIYFVFFYRKWRMKGKAALIVNSIMYLYIGLVLYATLMPVIVSLPFAFNNVLNHPYKPMNLLPFDDYFHGRGDTVRQIMLNVVMMIPFGFLTPVVKRCKLFSCMFRTLLFSLCIEVFQPLVFRSGDITDVITNTAGGLIGYLLYLFFKPVVNTVLLRLK